MLFDITCGGERPEVRAVFAGSAAEVEAFAKAGTYQDRQQFAMIQPSAAGRIDVGLILRDAPAGGRLESAAGFNALFTHRVRPVTGEQARRVAAVLGLHQMLRFL
jgi:hypothetical protein